MKMIGTMPVPIVTLTQEGEKLRMMRRQPWSSLDGGEEI